MATSQSKSIVTIIVVAVAALVGYSILTMPDHRTGTQKLGDAIHDLDKGPDKALRQLENRTPGEKIGDAVKDAGNGIKSNTGN